MQMQHGSEPSDGSILRPLQPFLLRLVIRITSYGETVRKLGEILIVVLDVQFWDLLVGVSLQVGREHEVVLRSDDLHRYIDGVNFFLGEKRGMGDGDAID